LKLRLPVRRPWKSLLLGSTLLLGSIASDSEAQRIGPVASDSEAQRTTPSAHEEALCDGPFRLLEAGLIDEAKEELRTILATGAEQRGNLPDCLVAVSEKLAKEFEQRGNVLRKIGALEAAQNAYVTAVRLRPELDDDLEKVLDPFTSVRELADLGEASSARARLKELLSVQPPRVVPEDLHYLHGGSWEWWRSVRKKMLRLVPGVVEIAAALVAVLLAVLLVPRIALGAFSLLRRKLLLRELQSGGEAAPSGGGLVAAVQSKILELARADLDSRIELVTTAGQNVDIPEVIGRASPVADGLTAVLKQLIQRIPLAPYEVTGALHDSGRQGPGVTLHFLRGKKVLAATTLWQGTYVPPGQADTAGEKASFYLLADAAAAWTLFQLKAHSRRPWQKPFRLLGTSDWQAFAMFQAGVRAFEQADRRRSAYCFQLACLRDRDFYAARINRGKVLYNSDRKAAKEQIAAGLAVLTEEKAPKEGSTTIWEDLSSRLEKAAEGKILEKDPPPNLRRRSKVKGHLTDPWYYQTRYAHLGLKVGDLVAAWRAGSRSKGKEFHQEHRELLDESVWFSRELSWAADSQRKAGRWLPKPWEDEREARLKSMARTVANALMPVVLALELLTGTGEASERLQSLQKRAGNSTALFSYNLACLLSLKAEERGTLTGRTVETAVQALERSVTLQPFRKGQIATDPLLVHLAKTDPFQEVFGDRKDKPVSAGTVAQLSLVGNKLGRALNEKGIESLQDLLLATTRREPRERLAFNLGVSSKLALRWGHLAEFCRIKGLEAETVNVLERAGVGSLETLAASDAKELSELLTSLQTALGHEIPIGDDDLVRWMDEAAECLPTLIEGSSH